MLRTLSSFGATSVLVLLAIAFSTSSYADSDIHCSEKGDLVLCSVKEQVGKLENPNSARPNARFVPNFKDDKVKGFKIFKIAKGSVFEKWGLQNGDVIQSINGQPAENPKAITDLMELAKSEDTITIDLLRRGNKKSLTLEIQ